ncbi:MAG TPA: UDP-N-acetylmuramoyl-L-alanine--D-glutamate ligase [Gaiellaceae bacterium]|nr:UDP-N-acetylmuramoyl-L-alanine--D-glutamate ligase [Gaiellaceae bacterium]
MRDRLRAVLPLLHRVPLSELPQRVLVLGLARSGKAASAALGRRGVEVVGVDRELGNEDDLTLLDGVELLVKSPGVPRGSPLVAEAERRGLPIWSEVELGYRLLQPRLVGVTGTNGKTTTVELLGAITGAPVAGNVGRALTELDGRVATGSLVVCELSSFQLEDVHELACEVAVLLNLEADHLDRYDSFEAYRNAKLRIFERARAKVVPRGLGLEGTEFAADDPLPAEPRIRGAHNRENAAAATAAARLLGISDEAIAEALLTFPGVPHRLEPVCELRGVLYVNDSKATNVAAALKALSTFEREPVHLILGGSRKGEDFEPLAAAIGPNVKSVHLIGETAGELAEAIPQAQRDGDLAGALGAIEADPGDVVLLSPACASYDQFRDFEERGEEFRRLVQNLSG